MPPSESAVTGHHLAQVNVARARAPLTDPLMADFVASIQGVNARADVAPGFVWRFVDPPGSSIGAEFFGDPLLVVNLSVWESVESLRAFVYQGQHLAPLRRRSEWFSRLETPHLALWWVPAGHRPTIPEARERLELLARHGESDAVFTFQTVGRSEPA